MEGRADSHEHAEHRQGRHLRRRIHVRAEHQEWSQRRAGLPSVGGYRQDTGGHGQPHDRPVRLRGRGHRRGRGPRPARPDARELPGDRDHRDPRHGGHGHPLRRAGRHGRVDADPGFDDRQKQRVETRRPPHSASTGRAGTGRHKHQQDDQANGQRRDDDLRRLRAGPPRRRRVQFLQQFELVGEQRELVEQQQFK